MRYLCSRSNSRLLKPRGQLIARMGIVFRCSEGVLSNALYSSIAQGYISDRLWYTVGFCGTAPIQFDSAGRGYVLLQDSLILLRRDCILVIWDWILLHKRYTIVMAHMGPDSVDQVFIFWCTYTLMQYLLYVGRLARTARVHWSSSNMPRAWQIRFWPC